MLKSALLINIVLYHPDKDNLIELIRICLDYESAKILLFDNSPYEQNLEYICSERIILYKSKKNIGVAGAHCYACKMAEVENFDFVLFLDQDSQLPENFINLMVSGFYHLQKSYIRLCAVGPSWEDPRMVNWYRERENQIKNKLKTKIKRKLKSIFEIRQREQRPNLLKLIHLLFSLGKFIRIRIIQQRERRRKRKYNLLRLDHILISSGMLVWVPTFKKIGYPKKEYFIDLVDIEWCLRALSKDYHIEIVKTVKMQHTIGEFKSLKRNFLVYKNPMRYYYSIRNSFYLFREKNYPISFRMFILNRNILEMKKIPFVPESKKSLLAAINGIKDGIFMKKTLSSIKE